METKDDLTDINDNEISTISDTNSESEYTPDPDQSDEPSGTVEGDSGKDPDQDDEPGGTGEGDSGKDPDQDDEPGGTGEGDSGKDPDQDDEPDNPSGDDGSSSSGSTNTSGGSSTGGNIFDDNTVIDISTVENAGYYALLNGGQATTWGQLVVHGLVTIDDNMITSVDPSLKGDMYIPSNIKVIGDSAFAYCEKITSIIIGSTTISIQDSAFSDCNLLKEIMLPVHVEYIGNCAFYNCKSLVEIYIPSGITHFSDKVFYNCTSLETINFPNTIKEIRDNAFYNCYKLKNFDLYEKIGTEVIPSKLISIGNYAFAGCKTLTKIDIPDSVTSIGNGAFSECTGITWVRLSENLGKISHYTFSGCSSLLSINIPQSVHTIGSYAFARCTKIETITMYYVSTIGEGAFFECVSATSIASIKAVSVIEPYTFYRCEKLTLVILTSQILTKIGHHAFFGCKSLEDLSISGNVTSIGHHAFFGCSRVMYLYVPTNVTKLEDYLFYGCSNAENVVCASTEITEIGEGVFNGCTKLSKPLSFINLKKVGKYAFANTGITSFDTSHDTSQLEELPDGLFKNCTSLTQITIPGSVTTVGHQVFAGCTSLTTIAIPDSIKDIKSDSFKDCKGKLQYSYSSVIDDGGLIMNNIYKKYRSWKELVETRSISISTINGEKTIFHMNVNVTGSLYIPSTIQYIGMHSFMGSRLTSLVIFDGVKEIDNGAFFYSKIESIVLPETLTRIHSAAFWNCKNLQRIVIPEGVTTIDDHAFDGCTNLESVSLPSTLKHIGDYAFFNCKRLDSINIPKGLKTIGKSIFLGCKNLSSANSLNKIMTLETNSTNNNIKTEDNVMNIYYVDCDNINWSGLDYLIHNSGNDIDQLQLFVGYKKSEENMPFDIFHDIINLGITCKVNVADTSMKNCIDFEITTSVGYDIGTKSNSSSNTVNNYIIVSNDTDYDVLVSNWVSKGVSMSRMDTIPVSYPSLSDSKIEVLVNTWVEIIQSDVNQKANCNNSLVKNYGPQAGTMIYQKIEEKLAETK